LTSPGLEYMSLVLKNVRITGILIYVKTSVDKKLSFEKLNPCSQARNQGGSLYKIIHPLEKCVGHSLKLLDIVQKMCTPLRKTFAPPRVQS